MARSDAPATEGASGYVSRGGTKLAAALDACAIDPIGAHALDAGASTGGFTDCLLQRGAIRVIAVDVAYGQLAWTLRNDERVVVVERTNVRTIDLQAMGERPVDLVVADLSFISLSAVRDALVAACAEGADLLLMVKPQFETQKRNVERGGVVRDPAIWLETLRAVADSYRHAGCVLVASTPSPLVGPAGNREFFVHLRRASGAMDVGDAALHRAVGEAP